MGRDKALLPMQGTTLLERTARLVEAVSGCVTLIGSPERYAVLGFPVIADLVEDAGPIGGVYTALQITRSEWNLIVACDMPGLTEDFLRSLVEAAPQSSSLCLVPKTGTGLHPLCAVYHRGAAAAVAAALFHKRFKMHDLLTSLGAVAWTVGDAAPLENVNTPVEWGGR